MLASYKELSVSQSRSHGASSIFSIRKALTLLDLVEQNKEGLEAMCWNENMEEAPRDGTQIILYKTPTKNCNVPFWVIGKYVGRYELLPYGQCYMGDDCCGECPEPEDFKIKVLVTSWNHKDISSTGFTHWMPLPTPPETTEEA